MIKSLYHLMLVTYPILSGYGFSPQADFGVLSLFFVGILYVFMRKDQFQLIIPRGYALFFVSSILVSYVFANAIPMRLILFTINLFIAFHCVDTEVLKKYYFRLVPLCCVYFILQEMSFRIVGSRISGLTTFLPIIYGNTDAYVLAQKVAQRSASFFLEPSYFAQFLFPYLVLKLFAQEKSNVRDALWVSAIMVLIRSGNGMILLALIWVMWLFFADIRMTLKISICFVISSMAGVFVLFNASHVESMMARTAELGANTGGTDYETSGFIRFFRGYFLYADLPLKNKLLGSEEWLIHYMMYKSVFLWRKDQFLNGIQMLLIYNGLFVCLLYLRHLLLFCKGALKKREVVVFVVGFVFLMFSESYYLCSRAFLTMLFIFHFIQNDLKSHCRKKIFF